jgi:hypothetical protein
VADLVGEDGLKYRFVSKKETALRQIKIALQQLNADEYEAAITLAGAAEGMLETGGFPTPLFENLKERRPPDFATEKEWISDLNRTRDWLKHNGNQKDGMVGEFDAWLMISRAITKYHGTYREKPREEVDALVEWGIRRKQHD